MVSKNGRLVIAGLGVLSLLFSIIYASSCTRPIEHNPWACNYVYCQNGGRCDSARCKCPVGFEGTDCSVATANKFLGNWNMHVTIVGSDSTELIGQDTTYVSDWKPTATTTTFFINRFNDNPNYNSVVCLLDSTDKDHFVIDTTSVLNMMYDHYRIRGGGGDFYIDTVKDRHIDTVRGKIFLRRLNATVNWQNDTVEFFAIKI